MNVAEYIADFLARMGVRHVFGYQGGAILKIVDEIAAKGETKYIQNYHEQGSAFCADAYSRVTGNIGVAMATSGPGATNLITGIANAHLDSIPTLFITGQDYTANITKSTGARQHGFQDLDIVSIVKPITKYAVMVTDEKRMRYEFEKAVYLAKSGRPGAVLIDIPIDVQFKDINVEELEPFIPPETPPASLPSISEVIDLIKKAKRPVVLAGGGVRLSRARQELRTFIKLTKLPIVSTLNGIDLVEGNYGFAGLHGNTCANLAVKNADLLLAIGAKFGQRQVGKNPGQYTQAKVVHIDIDPAELGRIFPEEIALKINAKDFLLHAIDGLKQTTLPEWGTWHATIKNWRDKYRSNAYLNQDSLDPVMAVEALMPLLPDDAIMTNDVGQNQMWVTQGFAAKGTRLLLNSCGHGSMGFSLPASIGARYACPDRPVICFAGDGGLQMNIQELMLIGQQRLNIKCFIFNNHSLGMIREVQERYYKGNYYGVNEREFSCVNLKAIAAAYDLGYKRIDSLDDIASLKPVIASDQPTIIELVISPTSRLSNRYDEGPCFDKEALPDAKAVS